MAPEHEEESLFFLNEISRVLRELRYSPSRNYEVRVVAPTRERARERA